MNDYILLSGVPLYEDAPVATDLLWNHLDELLAAMRAHNAPTYYLVMNKDDRSIEPYKKLASQQADLNLRIVEVKQKSGFAFMNTHALERVLQDEKPLPKGFGHADYTYSIEAFLERETKNFFVQNDTKKSYHIRRETSSKEIADLLGLGTSCKGIYYGYPMGRFVAAGHFEESILLETDRITVFDEKDCMLAGLKKIVDEYGNETCGRCVFGYEGMTQIQMILTDILARKGKPDDLHLLKELCKKMESQTLCDIDATLAKTVLSALEVFQQEIEEHVTKKVCQAAACNKFITYHILEDFCTGCQECEDVCEDDAIISKKKFIHIIDQDECTQCGKCYEACEEDAIVKAGTKKPKGPAKPVPCKAR